MGGIAGTRVLLTDGHARQVLPVARALRRAGCRVTVLCTGRLDFGWVSRWPDRRILASDARTDPAGFLRELTVHVASGGFDVIIPLTDCSAEVLSYNKPTLARFARVAVTDYEVFRHARDKLLTMRACAAHGVPHPRTAFDGVTPDAAARAGIGYPVALKPRVGDSAIGFVRVESAEALRELAGRTERRFGPMLVQEFVPQEERQYKAELFLDRLGVLAAAVVFAKIRWYPLEGGSSTLNVTVDRPDIVEPCARLLRALGWSGYADVDLIQDPRDGTCKIMEINPRVTGSVKLAFDAGVDFADLIVRDALGWDVAPCTSYEVGRYLRYFHKDVLWFLRSPERFRARPSWFDFRKTTDQIVSIADPLPGLAFSLQAFHKWAAYARRRNT